MFLSVLPSSSFSSTKLNSPFNLVSFIPTYVPFAFNSAFLNPSFAYTCPIVKLASRSSKLFNFFAPNFNVCSDEAALPYSPSFFSNGNVVFEVNDTSAPLLKL